MVLVDSNILLDVWNPDPVWAAWSQSQMRSLAMVEELAINLIIYAEVSPSYGSRPRLDLELEDLKIALLPISTDAAFYAGQAFAEYRKRGGTRTSVLADFFIGAHAQVDKASILTRDTRRYKTYFPTVPLITP